VYYTKKLKQQLAKMCLSLTILCFNVHAQDEQIEPNIEINAYTLQAFQASCSRLKLLTWKKLCSEASSIDRNNQGKIYDFFMHSFAWSEQKNGLLTAYYEPIIEASKFASDEFAIPVYGVPTSLVTLQLSEGWKSNGVTSVEPIPNKKSQWKVSSSQSNSYVIFDPSLFLDYSGNKLKGKIVGNQFVPFDTRENIQMYSMENPWQDAPILAWVHDAIDLFFMQIQGSGMLEFEDKTTLRLSYADSNGHKYRSIANYLIEQGQLTSSQTSMQTIRAWASVHPDKMHDLLSYNPSYIFFKPSLSQDTKLGPIGAMGIPLTPGYSLAVDPIHIPLGTPISLETELPNGQILRRLVIAQDTGSAIKGSARGDLFLGTGSEAGDTAGRMKQMMTLRLLTPLKYD
jgi:membrane-bound lytic murein transglycosylase A